MVQRTDTQINNFVGGLITEASPLNFSPNTALDILNFRLNKNGTVTRRLGIDFEDNYLLKATGYSTDVLATARKSFYQWDIPNGQTTFNIGIVQIGAKFWFLNLFNASPSTEILNGGNPIDAGVDPRSRFSFATINNYVIALSPSLPNPFLLSYIADTDTILVESAEIRVRDFWGVNDNLKVDDRIGSISPAHRYNLWNQGWGKDIKTTCGAGIDPIDCTFNTFGVYPSNSDTWALGRIVDLTSTDVYLYDPEVAAKNLYDTGQVPKGKFIIPIYNRGTNRSAQTGYTLPGDIEQGRLTTVASYAGRAFYSGINSRISDGDSRSPILSGTVFFSQLFESKIDLVQCYQEADPTSIDSSDVVDTDGGTIQIPECSVITKIQTVKDSLFVFAENGVWRIRGDEGGFRATSFQVDKISNIGVFSPDSIIEINGIIFLWGINGIYSLVPNEFGMFNTVNVTMPTIQTVYNSIPDISKMQVKGHYDLANNRLRWLYYSDDAKVAGNPVDTVPVSPPISGTFIGSPNNTGLSSGQIEPKVAKLTSTKFIMVYRDFATSNTIRGVVGTVNDDLSITYGTEQIIFTAATIKTAYSITYLEDNKVLFVYKEGTSCNARVFTIAGTVISTTAATTLNTEINSVYLTNPIRTQVISSGTAWITFNNTDNNKPSLQVVNISSLNVITFGSVYKSTTISATRCNLVALTSTTGVSVVTTGSRITMETFTVAGSVVTFSAVQPAFPNTTQIPGPTTYSSITSFVHPISATRVLVTAVTTTTNPSVTSAMYSWIADISGSAITSTTILKQDSEVGTVPVSLLLDGKSVIVYRKNPSGSNFTPRLLYNLVSGSTPSPIRQVDTTAFQLVSAQEIVALTNDTIAVVWEGGGAGTTATSMALRIS